MATIKSYTDIEQSHNLAEIIPLETSDMIYTMVNGYHTPWIRREKIDELDKDDVPCWSLAALLSVIGCKFKYDFTYNGKSFVLTVGDFENLNKNLIDACVAMIEKLHELNLL